MHVAAFPFGGECTGLLLRRSQEGLWQATKTPRRAFWQSASMHGVRVYYLNYCDLSTHKPLRHNPHECISARILNAPAPRTRDSIGSVGPCWAFTWRFEHAQAPSSQTSRLHFGTDSKCTCSRALGLGSMGPRWAFTLRFEHAQTASSQPSRMHFGTDSKCIRSPCSGLGV